MTGPVLLLAAWWAASNLLYTVFLPPLTEVASAFASNWVFERVSEDVLPSLRRLATGYVLGVAGGILVGTVLGLSRWLSLAFEPVVEFVRALPKIAIIPLLLIIMGAGDLTKVTIIAMTATVPVLYNTLDGIRSLDPSLADTAKIYRFSRRQRIALVTRWASPQIFAGSRVSLALAFILMVTSEMMASTNGIGYFVLTSQRTFAIADMWSGILLLGILGFLFNIIFVIAERRLMSWYRGFKQADLGSI